MPSVTIVRPNNTPEQEKEVLRNIAGVMEKIVHEKYGTKVEIELYRRL